MIAANISFTNGKGFKIPFPDKEQRDEFMRQLDRYLGIELKTPTLSNEGQVSSRFSSPRLTYSHALTGNPPSANEIE